MTNSIVKDELEALQSIYGEECIIIDNQVKIKIPSCKARCTLTLNDSYPHTSGPVVTVEVDRLSTIKLSSIVQSTNTIWRGDTCCFDIIEHVRGETETACQEFDTIVAERNASNSVIEQPNSHVAVKFDNHQNISQQYPDFIIGQSITDRKSVFIPYYCPVKCEADIKAAVESLHSNPKLSRATHIMHAYILPSSQAFDDDGENAAGSRMLHLLRLLKCCNVFVAVVRYYGGTPLGPARFKHINTATRQVLEQANIVEPGKRSNTVTSDK